MTLPTGSGATATVDWAGYAIQYLHLTPDANGKHPAGPLLASLGTGVQSAIESYISRRLGAATYTEAYSGDGKGFLYLKQTPVISVLSLSIGGATVVVGDPEAPTYPAATYVIDEGERLMHTGGGVFDGGVQNVLVTYTAGLDPVPADIIQAGVMWLAVLFKDRDRAGIKSESVGGQNFSFTNDMPAFTKQILDQWVRVWVP